MALLMIGATGYVAASDAQLDSPHHAVQASSRTAGYTPFQYAWYSGATFVPFASETEYRYKSAGCIYKTGGVDERFLHKVVLPDNAVIHYVRMYSYDDSTSNIRGFLTTYDAAGDVDDLTQVDSVDGGYGSVLSPLLNYTVGTYNKSINIVVRLSDDSAGNLALCGVRIAYKVRPDIIFKAGFE